MFACSIDGVGNNEWLEALRISREDECGYVVVRGLGTHELLHLINNGRAQFLRARRSRRLLKHLFRALQSEFFRLVFCFNNSARHEK